MPILEVRKALLFEKLGKEYIAEKSKEEKYVKLESEEKKKAQKTGSDDKKILWESDDFVFDDLCFDFGLELDEVTSEYEKIKKEISESAANERSASNEKIYKIEIPANRYDLLCVEGLSRALKIFLKINKNHPNYRTLKPDDSNIVTINVKPETKKIREFIVGAVLRNIEFNEDSYDSFIKLQEKLHFNICRHRTLVAIG